MTKGTGYRAIAERVATLTRQSQEFHGECINLIASENVTSPAVRRIVGSDFMHRYAEYERHDVGKRYDDGSSLMVEVEKIGNQLATELFGGRYVDLRPISGHIAIIACLLGLMPTGGSSLEVSGPNGGHEYHVLAKYAPAIQYTPEWLPFDVDDWGIDLDATVRKIRRTRPDIIILGSSFYLFPDPTKEVREAADETGSKVLYDGAHVMGLIGGGVWPNPLEEGAQMLTGSTHKTFPGPQKGIILTNDENLIGRVRDAVYPTLLTNHHLMDVAALTYAMAEFLEFGRNYAAQTVKNSVALAEALSGQGLDVIGERRGFTRSHQVLVRTSSIMPGPKAAKLLASGNILCNKMLLDRANGLRIGVAEATRVGMKQAEMLEIAELMGDVLLRAKEPKSVARKARELAREFGSIRFSFESGKPAYA